MARKFLACIGVLVLGLAGLWTSCSNDAPVSPTVPTAQTEPPPESVGLSIGPIPGLTTAWHPAPTKFSVTNDVKTIQFKFVGTGERTISWKGAVEVSRNGNVSIAECQVPAPGDRQQVEVTAWRSTTDGSGETVTSFSSGFGVVSYSAEDMPINEIILSDAEPRLDQYVTPVARMRLLLSGRSIAVVTNVSKDRYRTAVGTLVHAKASTDNSGVLIEWRLDGSPILLGAEGDLAMSADPGTRTISVGSPAKPHGIRIDTYRTSIAVEGGRLRPGELTKFRVTTSPPGFESDVLWMSGTLFGAAEPAVGRGATFETVFDNPWPTTPDGIICMGVRAGSTSLIVETPPSFESDMTRLNSDLGGLGDALGSRVCCISDSLAKQNYYDALNGLVKARDKISIAISTYQGLGKIGKAAVNLAYGGFASELQGYLGDLEASIASLNAQPPCGGLSASTSLVRATTFCEDLCNIARLMAKVGGVLLVVGVLLSDLGIGVVLMIAGGSLLAVGVIILLIAGPSGLGCC